MSQQDARWPTVPVRDSRVVWNGQAWQERPVDRTDVGVDDQDSRVIRWAFIPGGTQAPLSALNDLPKDVHVVVLGPDGSVFQTDAGMMAANRELHVVGIGPNALIAPILERFTFEHGAY